MTDTLTQAPDAEASPSSGSVDQWSCDTPRRHVGAATNVIQALAAVSADLEAVTKARKVDGPRGYSFRGIEDMYNALHGPLAKHGVVIIPRAVEQATVPINFGNKTAEKGWHKVSLTVEYDVYGPGGVNDCLPRAGRVCVDAEDNSDKGYGKAMSYAYKNFAVQLFTIPTEDVSIDNEAPAGQHVPEMAHPGEQHALLELLGSLDDHSKAKVAEFCKAIEVSPKSGAGLTVEMARLIREYARKQKAEQTEPEQAA